MAISPVVQQISVIQSAVGEAARVVSRSITEIVVTNETIRVVAHDESVEFGIAPPGVGCDEHGVPLIGGSLPTLTGDAHVRIDGPTRRCGVPGAAMLPKRLIMLRGVIEYAAHRGNFPIAALRVCGPFVRVTGGGSRRWLLCARARYVPYPPYGGYDETTFIPIDPSDLVSPLRAWLRRPR